MTEERRKESIRAFCEYAEKECIVPGTIISNIWLAAVEWADNNLSDVCSTTGLGDIPIGRRPIGRRPIRKNIKKTESSAASAD